MNSFYIISYKGRNSNDFKELIKMCGSWFNIFENQYIVCTSYNIATIKQHLEDGINKKTDIYLILEIELLGRTGLLPKNAWDWIKSQEQRTHRGG